MPMTTAQLHDALDALVTTEKRPLVRIVGHALIALGLLTELECAYEDCVLPSRVFSMHDGVKRYDKASPTVDHVIELWDGGTDRPENLRLVHFACNSSKSMKMRVAHDARYLEKLSQTMQEKWQEPKFRAMHRMARSDELKARVSQTIKNLPDKKCDTCNQMFKATGLGPHSKACKARSAKGN